ncbi:MAG: hypothetical protein IKM39_00940, partial [Clostridia bacterium]|nr:hypothetical protein [Clostridia bacterium]
YLAKVSIKICVSSAPQAASKLKEIFLSLVRWVEYIGNKRLVCDAEIITSLVENKIIAKMIDKIIAHIIIQAFFVMITYRNIIKSPNGWNSTFYAIGGNIISQILKMCAAGPLDTK